MAFQFGFGGDDIEEDAAMDGGPTASPPTASAVEVAGKPVQLHELKELVDDLPEHVSYSTVRIESPTGRVIHLPKRELYDVRVQLLGEAEDANDEVIDQLDKSDIREGVYEGGFKTWECSHDLASLLLDRGPRKDIDELVRCDQVVELGAGSALPTLALFQHALQHDTPLNFVLSDYNDSVLRLVTLPNLILTWAAARGVPGTPSLNLTSDSHGDLELPPPLREQFLADLASNNITLMFVSGPWSSELAALIPHSSPEMGSLLLAAETVYSPASTVAFADLMVQLLQRTRMSKAMIGAKRLYFGVGGSVDGLKEACRERGACASEVENHGVVKMEGGVGRALVEVQMF